MNNKNFSKNFYIGLDIGTDSVGYAVTDSDFSLLKHRGEPMWGTHIVEDAQTAEERRSFRTARRRLDRRQQRMQLIQELFAKEIAKVDKDFYKRIKESSYVDRDKSFGKGIFKGAGLDDKTYNKMYPTIHHLIMSLINNTDAHDVRLVYTACAWLVAHRGHFLSEISKDNIEGINNFNELYDSFITYFDDIKPWNDIEPAKICDVLENGRNITTRKKELLNLLFNGKKPDNDDEFPYSRQCILALLSGGECKSDDLFIGMSVDSEKISLNMDDENFEKILMGLGDEAELLLRMKTLVDCVALKKLIGNEKYISACKVKTYEQHKKDLALLKHFVKKYCPDKYKEIFVSAKEGNYVAYSKNVNSIKNETASIKSATQESFCKYIRSVTDKIAVEKEDETEYLEMRSRLENNTFMPKQVTGDNRIIPYQLYYVELKAILENACKYLPFLSEEDADGLKISDKILSVFEFRIPYFVGPLNKASKFAWLKTKAEGKIYPWNFEEKIDLDASEQEFIKRMTNKCTYLPDKDVLPKASLLYQKFEVLNEINTIKVNDIGVTVEIKQRLFNELFVESKKKVTLKRIKEQLISDNLIDKNDTVSGTDENIKSSLSSYHAFKRLTESGILKENEVEEIILQSTVSEERYRFKKWLLKKFPKLCEEDIKHISAVKCKGFGRLSKEFLNGGIWHTNKSTGEIYSLIKMLWDTNCNLNQLLSENFDFKEQIENAQKEFYDRNKLSLAERLDTLYVSNSVRRPIIRSLDIINDIVKANGGKHPEKIFIEMARDGEKKEPRKKGNRTKSRYEQLTELYSKTEMDTRELQKQLDEMGENVNSVLQSEKLFLYYLQLGKSAYSGKDINLEDLKDDGRTNVDHIFPRARITDNSVINNKVLCLSEENDLKKDIYPVSAEWRSKMTGFWASLKSAGLMSEEKFKRLTRSTPFTNEEKWGFINRQLVETRQSTKVLAELLKEKFPDTEIVYVKAGIVSDFRNEYDFLKSRSVNDLHHAKDAYLNIVVGDVYNRKFTKQWFLDHLNDYSLNLSATFGKFYQSSDEWKPTKYFSETMICNVGKTMRKNNIHYTIYPFCKHGGFFDQNPVKKVSGLIPRKKDLPTEIYGGYNRPTVSFFVLASFMQKKKKELMFVPVHVMDRDKFDDKYKAIEYIKKGIEEITGNDVTDLTLPFGMRKIKLRTIFEVDGFRLALAGKDSGGKKVAFRPVNALTLNYDEEKYIKHIERFCEKIENNPKLSYSEKYDKINKEHNEELYKTLLEKIKIFYYKRPLLSAENVGDSFEKFTELDIKEQSVCLLRLVSFFGRNAIDYNKFFGCGACNLNAKISNWTKYYKEAFIIDSSASGIYEKRSENLLELLK